MNDKHVYAMKEPYEEKKFDINKYREELDEKS